MEATQLLRSRDETLAKYHQLREVVRDLNERLVETLAKDTIHEAGRLLGVLKRNRLVLDSEQELAVIMDYAIHQVRRDGSIAIDRYLAAAPYPPDSTEMKLLGAMGEARFGLFQANRLIRGVGIMARDVLRDEGGLLVDVSFSRSLTRGDVIAGHVLFLPDGFRMCTGAALPVFPRLYQGLFDQLRSRFGREPDRFRNLSKAEHAELATLVIRTCLEAGMAQRIAYDTPGVHTPHRPPRAPTSGSARVGRNAPCPCGSGRKYKSCCRGKKP